MENLVDPSIALSPSYWQINDELRFEALRLNTFRSWPAEARIDPTRVAKAGFFYTGKQDEVQCFACRGKIQCWNYGDQAMARHRQMNPSCPFVLNRSSNVPTTSTPTTPSQNTPMDVQPPGPSSQVFSDPFPSLGLPYTSSLPYNSSPTQVSEGYGSDDAPSSHESSPRSSSSEQESLLLPSAVPTSSLSLPFRRAYRSFEEWQALLREEVRFRTFGDWTVPFLGPRDLSRWGFFYTGVGDSVQCNFCQGVIGNWVQGDDPETRHRVFNPSCPLVLGLPVGNVTASDRPTQRQSLDLLPVSPRTENVSSNGEEKWEQLGITAYRGPQNKHFSTYESRLSSYENWPVDRKQSADIMAQSGFFYLGVKDHVKCFHCNGGLRNWEANDDPWVEHARWFSRCGFLRLVRGDQFIKECLEKLPQQLESKTQDPPSMSRTASDSMLRDMMTSPVVKAVLEMGIDSSRIKQALRRRFSFTTEAFPSVESLLKAALDVQHDDEHRQQLEYENTDQMEWEARRRQTAPRYISGRVEDESTIVVHETAEPAEDIVVDGIEPPRSSIPTANTSGNETYANVAVSIRNEISEVEKPATEPIEQSVGTPSISRSQELEKSLALEEENRRLKEARLCKVCMDNEVGVVFLPCGHLITCVQCAPSLTDCPLCRQNIRGTVRTFLA